MCENGQRGNLTLSKPQGFLLDLNQKRHERESLSLCIQIVLFTPDKGDNPYRGIQTTTCNPGFWTSPSDSSVIILNSTYPTISLYFPHSNPRFNLLSLLLSRWYLTIHLAIHGRRTCELFESPHSTPHHILPLFNVC